MLIVAGLVIAGHAAHGVGHVGYAGHVIDGHVGHCGHSDVRLNPKIFASNCLSLALLKSPMGILAIIYYVGYGSYFTHGIVGYQYYYRLPNKT